MLCTAEDVLSPSRNEKRKIEVGGAIAFLVGKFSKCNEDRLRDQLLLLNSYKCQ